MVSQKYPISITMSSKPSLTLRIPILTGIFMQFQELSRWRPQEGDHLGKMLFVIKLAIFHGVKESRLFK
jgi:hypothetical protein